MKRKGKNKYSYEFKLKCVKLCLEEGYPRKFVADESGANLKSLGAWIKRYREEGEQGLKLKPKGKKGRQQVHPETKEKIIELKKQYPIFGIKRISDLLKRVFFLKASPETVRKTLHEEKLIEKERQKPRKNPQKPRFFARTRPNQMWQTDIFSFRLGGQAAYLLAFIDDYSRYMVGLGLYRRQTAENLLEVYRRATGEYNCPAEMLTDNGRQYTNWRGTTRFEKELKKDRIKHIRSQSHHPMTLGKIERFWKTIWTEFLDRCQFDCMETAQQRIALWIKYYNHQRPHQGIGGLCPADRYFEVTGEVRQVIERGIEKNTLEQALRGRSEQAFYMVGRMNGQSVVLEAEKGKVKLNVDGVEARKEQIFEVLGDEKDDREEEGRDESEAVNRILEQTGTAQEETRTKSIHSSGENRGCPGYLDGKFESERDLPEPRSRRQLTSTLAGSGDGGYLKSHGASEERSPKEHSKSTPGEAAQPSHSPRIGSGDAAIGESYERNRRYDAQDLPSDVRSDNSSSSLRRIGDLPSDLLRAGRESPKSHAPIFNTRRTRTPSQGGGSRKGATQGSGERPPEADHLQRTKPEDSGDPQRGYSQSAF